jgi:hypothetical protein
MIAFSDIEDRVLAHYKYWMNTWLLQREQSVGLDYYTIARPRSYRVKQAFSVLPGEEQTPIVIAVSDGFAEQPVRRGSGDYDSLLRFGIAAVCYGNEGSSRELCGHYQSALLNIAIQHTKIDDSIALWDFINLRIEDIDEEAIGRSMSAVRIELLYRVNAFVSVAQALPVHVPDGAVPVPPVEHDVEHVFVNADLYKPDEEFP